MIIFVFFTFTNDNLKKYHFLSSPLIGLVWYGFMAHHLVSSHSCCMYVRAGRPAFAWPYAGFHRSTSLMSSTLLLQQCPACLVCLTCIVFVMGGRWPYSWCLVGCCRQDLALKTSQKRWMIGRSGERGSGISVLAARNDGDDDGTPTNVGI